MRIGVKLNENYKSKIKLILVLAFPAIVENILHVLIGTVDTYFISRLGTEALASVGVTNLIMNIYIAFFLAIGTGTTAIVSKNIGKNNKEMANDITKQSVILALFIGVILGIVNLIFSEYILEMLGAEENIIEYALKYFNSVAVPCVFLCLMMTLSSALRGAGDTKTPMKIAFICNILNIFLNYILIFGFSSFPGFGILGAGIATTISRMLGVILLFIKLNNSKGKINIKIFEKWKINKDILSSIMKIGLPAGIEKLIMRVGQLVYNGMIIQLGIQVYAAHNIAGTIEAYSYLPGMGFGIAASTLVGQYMGAGKDDEAKSIGIIANILSTIFMVSIGLVFYRYSYNLARLFTSDEEILDLVVTALRMIALVQPFLSITLVITSALQGAGDTKFPMYTTFMGIWGIRVLGVYIFAIKYNYGLFGVWLSIIVDIIIRSIILMVRFWRGKWKFIDI